MNHLNISVGSLNASASLELSIGKPFERFIKGTIRGHIYGILKGIIKEIDMCNVHCMLCNPFQLHVNDQIKVKLFGFYLVNSF